MSTSVWVRREKYKSFMRSWEHLFEVVPEARAKAVEEMGKAVKQELDSRIMAADLSQRAKGRVRTWQEIRLGSEGGYSAVSPAKGYAPHSGKWLKTWKGQPVTKKQVTTWLDRGHGVPGPLSHSWLRRRTSRLDRRTGRRFVPGRQFYSDTHGKALDLALQAADRVLCKIAEEVDV